MHVLLVSNEAEIVGGGEISLLLLLQGLLDHPDCEPVLAVPAEGEVAVRARTLGARVITLPLPRFRVRPWLLPAARRRAAGIELVEHPDLVHCNGARAMLVAGVAARRLGYPVLWHVRVEGRDVLDRFFRRWCSAVVAPSVTVARRFPPDRVQVVANPVALPAEEPDEAHIAGLRRELAAGRTRLLLAVGELTPRKGHRRIVSALAGLAGADWQLVIAGREDPAYPGTGEEIVALARRLGLADRITLLGFREDVDALMRAADLLIHAPDAEGFGRVFIEAMAAGLPLVVTPVGGLAELHRETGYGWLADDLSERALAGAVETALANAAGREWCRRVGPEMAAERYSVAAHTRRIVALYRSLIPGGTGSVAK